ncbi:outer membrane receptor for Fe(III)-dicitrate FecA [Cupriavidus basilensis OR16]|uniref:Outer membrane receptor for Fe(III)-dicitrate FecA n=1 Tax=Cupriavidus basilensis OR16 TaxID=1127483 RepID=H1S6M8_9BURK|nr:hypothetical protein [Cupriavidus basilensis]EHP41689.1 outer membrane receptor for Fe(III)-dicitrate FecA [Cupriavidus basilensis OR16]
MQPTFKLSSAAIGAAVLCLTLSARAATPATTPDPAAQGAFSAESTLNAGTRGSDISLNVGVRGAGSVRYGPQNLFDRRHFTRSTDNNAGKYVGMPRTFYVQASLAY